MANPYHKVAEFVSGASVEELRRFFLDILKIQPEAVLHVLNYGDGVWMEEVMTYLRDRKKINAIKVHRHNTGMTLKESKDAVEAIIDEYFPAW